MRRHRIAAIGGDGVGPEMIEAGLSVLADLAGREGFAHDVTRFDWGLGLLPPHRADDAGGRGGTTEGLRSYLFRRRRRSGHSRPYHALGSQARHLPGLDQYANVRSTKLIGGMHGPLRPELGEQIDWVIATGNVGPSAKHPSMYEPIHGSAFDIMGKGHRQPDRRLLDRRDDAGTFRRGGSGQKLMAAIETVSRSGPHTPDLGGQADTRAVTDAILNAPRRGG